MTTLKKFKSIQRKLILYFIMLIIIISLVTGAIEYKVNSDRILESTRQEVSKLAAAGALLIDGDSHTKLISEQDESSATYKEIRAKMQEFQEKTGIAYVYTLAQGQNKTTQFIIDADPEDALEIGYEYDYLPAMDIAFQGSPSADEEMYTDQWGTVLSGYAPIMNSDGTVYAIIGVDIDASHILEQKKQLIFSTTISIAFGVMLTFILSIFFSRKILKPIRVLVNRLQELSTSGGDLTKKIEIKTGDELEILGNAVTDFIGNIRDIAKQVIDTSEGVANSAEGLNVTINESQKVVEEVTTSIQNIASGASEQAENVNEVSHGVQNITIGINENQKKVAAINNSVDETRKLINTGLEAINNQNIKTQESIEAFKKATEVVGKLATQAEEVGSILLTITNISQQTNLLALNAAIEAARAGEHGRGFSVVADEVRKLAEGSTQATKEIEQILQRIKTDAKNAIEQMNQSNLIAQEQRTAIDSTNLTFHNMTQEIEDMMNGINTISTSFKVIAENTNNISNRIQSISSVSQENAAMAEEVSASSEEQNAAIEEIGATAENLDNLSKKLKSVISKFHI